jgi:hypothetical protein
MWPKIALYCNLAVGLWTVGPPVDTLVEFCCDSLQSLADPGGRAVQGVGMRPFACWDCGFESRRRHGYLSLVSVVCCEVEVCASGRSLVKGIPTEWDVSECDREASRMRRLLPSRGCCAIGGGGGGGGGGGSPQSSRSNAGVLSQRDPLLIPLCPWSIHYVSEYLRQSNMNFFNEFVTLGCFWCLRYSCVVFVEEGIHLSQVRE